MSESKISHTYRKLKRLFFQSIDMTRYYFKSRKYKQDSKYKNMWLISDRGTEAKDNGYAFFEYIRKNHPEINAHYVIDSSYENDYNRVKSLGNIIEYGSEEHKIAFILCDKAICSYIGFLEPWAYKLYKLILDRKSEKKFIFLQHGITLHDVSDIYKKSATKIDLFITTTDNEYKAIKSADYEYDSNQVVQTGFARYDKLHDRIEKNQILLMPTWRKDIVNPSYVKYKLVDDTVFTNSEYYKSYNSLLNNDKLIDALNKFNIELVFYPHYEIQPYLKYFNTTSDKVIIASKDEYDVQALLKESKLLISDYSSVVFDFAYMEKPSLYYQFDELTHYKKGYFEYERDGFGDVVKEEDILVDKIIEIMNNQFKLSDKYQDRIKKCFRFRDNKNCERIFDEIMKQDLL